jgi:HEAT repeat protein
MLWWNKQQLKSKSAKTRRLAVEAMAATENASVLKPLVEALQDEDPTVRAAAAKGFGKLKDERSAPPLITALNDRNAEVRAAAAQSLRFVGDARAITPLVMALKDTDHGVRWHTANTLKALGWEPGSDTELILRSVALGQHEDAANHGGVAVDELVKMLQDKTCPRRRNVAEALGKTRDPRAAKPLEIALRDEDNLVRVAAVEALRQIGSPQSTNALLGVLRDRDHHVRAAAVEALGRMGEARVVEPISEFLLKDASWEVRKLSVEALGHIKDERGTELLCYALKDEDHDVRQTAANCLGQIPDPRSIGPLVLALTDENSSVRQAAKAALRQIDRQWEISEGAQSVTPQLEAALNHREYWVQQSAADTLAKINDMRQRNLDSAALVDPVKKKRELAVSLLTEVLRDHDRDLRQAAAEALGRIEDLGVITPLVSALDDQNRWVARAAALALNHLNWQPAPGDVGRAEKVKTLMLQT